MKFRTRAIHVGSEPDATGAVIPPIYLATTFIQPGAGEWGTFDYSRSGSPTRARVEQVLANLEGAAGALAFSSGMAATHCAMMLLEAGSHVVAGSDIYGGTYRLLHKICNRNQIEVSLVPAYDAESIANAIRPNTKMVWIESIGNPLMTIPDIPAIASITRSAGILLGVDSTFVPPCIMRPLEHGADLVMHSATKALGGHSDCLAGVLAARDRELHQRLYFTQNATGAVLGGLESFLLHRGIKTLALRVREQCRSALMIAQWLESHPRVRRVLYPGLASHPQHERARKMMGDQFGTMISFELNGDLAETKRVCGATKLFGLAVSLGAVESLIEQPATMSHASYDAMARATAGISDSLIRISIGLEDTDDLIEDLNQAMGT
ncbi:MAG: PLP-dependent aspartate aminotransferase family protein [Pirellula sp.]|jgi:cystathionine gamma-lyase|nr:PLP-dependent aspartate aminotransferase family protein [Pirellula sp.]